MKAHSKARSHRTYWTACGIAAAIAIAGCAGQQKKKEDHTAHDPAAADSAATAEAAAAGAAQTSAAMEALARLQPTTDTSKVEGTVTFTAVPEGGVRVNAEVAGLTPGLHGFHVHEGKSCDSAGMAAGGHFNPTSAQHGLPTEPAHHIGDMGNLAADSSGKAALEQVFPHMTLQGENSIVGRAIIVHAQPDDGGQPTGNAGGRVACAVIEAQGAPEVQESQGEDAEEADDEE